MNSGGHDFPTYCAPSCARAGVELEDQVVLIVGQFGTMQVATTVDFPCRFPLRGGEKPFGIWVSQLGLKFRILCNMGLGLKFRVYGNIFSENVHLIKQKNYSK